MIVFFLHLFYSFFFLNLDYESIWFVSSWCFFVGLFVFVGLIFFLG